MNSKKLLILAILAILYVNKSFSQTLEIPVITNVTVDKATQQALISWSMSDPAAVDGYIIKRQIFGQAGVVEGSFNTVETINNPNQFSYLDISVAYGASLPGSGIENYRVASFKDFGGGNIVFSNMSEPVSSIYLSPIEFDLCLEQNTLHWTAYNGFGTNLTGYTIYYSNTLTGATTLLGQVGATDTTFIHVQIEANTLYYYYVEAASSDGLVSNSNSQQITTTMPAIPQIMNADYANVELYEQVDLSFSVDENAEVNAYLLLKSDSLNGSYDTIASYPRGTSTITHSDFLKTNQKVAYYKVLAINTCGLPSRESNVANNIVLEAYPDEANRFTNLLNWNPYEDWLGGVAGYTVYRSIDGSAFEQIASLGANETSYSDDVTDFVQPEYAGEASKGHFCYYAEATEGAGNPYGVSGLSKSNISCAHQEAIVHLPNAFNPKSNFEENRTFKPVASFASDYQLIIYNRWGEIVFQSSDPLNGWDGRKNGGNLLMKGTYVFRLQYRTKNNELIKKSGQINLVY